jgi:hypothetical protein
MVIGGGAGFDVGRGVKRLLRIGMTAEVGGMRSGCTVTFGRCGAGYAAVGFAVAGAGAPGGRWADAGRPSALIEALRGGGWECVARGAAG